MNRRMLLLLTLTTLLVALTSWLSYRSDTPAPQQGQTVQQAPDYFLHGLVATVTDANGNISHNLSAESLLHYPDTDTTALQQPVITTFGPQRSDWVVRAEQGEIAGQEEEIMLRGSVQLEQRGETPLQLLTDWLRIDAEHQLASTDAPVLLTSPAARVEGIGMQAYGKEQRLQLHSTVRGHYVFD